MTRHVILFLSFFLLLSRGWAADMQLTQEAIQEASTQGKDLVSQALGYELQDWVLWDDDDPFLLHPDEGQIEAVIVGTPFERLRYQSYLATYQDKQFDAEQQAEKLVNRLSFVVFAHSEASAEENRNFLSQFTEVKLELDSLTLRPVDKSLLGPAQDFYTIPGQGAEFRFLGSISFHFDLTELDNPGEGTGSFSFTAPSGQDYTYEFNLANYQ